MENFQEQQLKEKTDENVFRGYIEDLKLTPDDFEKKILDVGAGSAQFAKWAKEHGVSDKIYSLEIVEDYLEERENSVVALAEQIPFPDNSFGLIISNAAIPNIYIGEQKIDEMENNVRNSLSEMVRVLEPGGEIRLGRVLIGKKYSSQINLSQSIEQVFKDFELEKSVEIEKIRTPSDDTYEYDKNGKPVDILAEAFLIILRKTKN